jgi:DNA polymerase III delta prime subunit
MGLRGKQPTELKKRLKLLMYGPAGVGKTTAAIAFPKPYLFDTERGAENAQYVAMLKARGGAVLQTSDCDEIIQEVKALRTEKHDYQTVVIDPLTVVYNQMLDVSAEEVGTDFGRHKMVPDRKIKRLLGLLLALDMNVIITSHQKAKYERATNAKGKETVVEAGSTFDAYAKLDYLFDLVLELGKRGKVRTAKVVKTRIEGFPESEVFDFSYDEVANRYGRDILEKSAVPEKVATQEQIERLAQLVQALSIPQETVAKWLDKAGVDEFVDMREDQLVKCIEYCEAKIPK